MPISPQRRARAVSLSPYDKMAIEVVELDGHRIGGFVVAYGSPDV